MGLVTSMFSLKDACAPHPAAAKFLAEVRLEELRIAYADAQEKLSAAHAEVYRAWHALLVAEAAAESEKPVEEV